MRKLRIEQLVVWIGCLTGAGLALGQNSARRDDGWSMPRAASLGLPQPGDPDVRQTGFWDSPGSSGRDSNSSTYTARRFDELPPPVVGLSAGAELPPPSAFNQKKGQEHEIARPFTIDYVFLARSPVDGPDNAITMNEVGVNYQFRIPIGERTLVTFRPLFDVLFLTGPDGPSPTLPPELYKLAIDMQADISIAKGFGISFGVTPGFWSDFKSFGSKDFRIPTRLLGTFKVSEELFIAAGIDYTDNFYRNLLPAGGVIWNVSEQMRLELLWPRSRIVYKLRDNLQFYSVWERGGDTYYLNDPYGEQTQYRDYRIMVGSQVDMWQRVSIFGEVGVAYNRVFKFDVQPQTGIGNSLAVRTGIRF